MKSLVTIQAETLELFKGRAIFSGINEQELIENINDIASFAALQTAEAIKSHTPKQKIFTLDTETMSEADLEKYFANLLLKYEVTAIDQLGKQRFAVIALEHAPDLA